MRVAAGLTAVVVLVAGCGGVCPGVRPPVLPPERAVLLDPAATVFAAHAPDTFRVHFETTVGDLVIEVYRAWAPAGADRFDALVRAGFYDDVAFFRVVPGFVVQFGLHGVPAVNEAWDARPLPDDPVVGGNERGTITYAKAGPDSRTTQLFINYRDNTFLDRDGFAPFGRVVDGFGALLRVNGEYGDFPPAGNAPRMVCMQRAGNAYLARSYPRLDYIRRARVVGG
jgi:peptidyl-prolyl cis-trans isomerase A (cyclophilin A)